MHTRQSALRIAVASVKGGVGKTTVATNLAAMLAQAGRRVTYMDADVEAPNGHLFLAPVLGGEHPVELPVPRIDAERCVACGRCAAICEYGALIALGRRILLVDAPPGTACAVVQAVEGADYVVLVAEPTPFGLHDFQLIEEMMELLGLSFGVVINRADEGTGELRHHCAARGIEVLLELPDDRRIAEVGSRGELVVEALPEYRSSFAELFARIEERAAA